MKPLLLIALLGITFVIWQVSRNKSVDGLFIPRLEEEPSIVANGSSFNLAFPVDRLELTRAVFRSDSEDDLAYWLELDFTKLADPGDMYVFRIGEKELSGFSVRGEGSNVGGGRWALGINDIEFGRKTLQEIARIYGLDASNVIDETKGAKDEHPSPSPVTTRENSSKFNPKPVLR